MPTTYNAALASYVIRSAEAMFYYLLLLNYLSIVVGCVSIPVEHPKQKLY